MAYLQDNQYLGYTKKRNKGFWYVVAIVVVFIFVFIFKNIFSHFSYSVAVPIINTTTAFERGIYTLTHSKPAMLRRIEYLESENEELRTKIVNYALIENENNGFKLSVLNRSDAKLASVIGKPSLSEYDTLIVSLPDDVSLGMKVYTISGVPLGTVTNISGKNGTVTLYSSPGVDTNSDVILADAMDSISVTMRGRGGASFEAIIPNDITLPVGSLAVLPSLFNEPFAEVVKTVTRDDAKGQVVYLRSIVNFQYLRYVVIGE